jgi:hypothetical protein
MSSATSATTSSPAGSAPTAAAATRTGEPPGRPGPAAVGAPRRTRRPPRLASLQLKRLDPWTVLKISLIVSVVMFFVWMIAIGILWLSLQGMGVWGQINSTFSTLTSADATTGSTDLITPVRVFGVAAVIGAINIVLFTLLSTVAAFVYNAAAAMSGGVELTLSERD